jgi:hypothetical protein
MVSLTRHAQALPLYRACLALPVPAEQRGDLLNNAAVAAFETFDTELALRLATEAVRVQVCLQRLETRQAL